MNIKLTKSEVNKKTLIHVVMTTNRVDVPKELGKRSLKKLDNYAKTLGRSSLRVE